MTTPPINFYSLICSRDSNYSNTTKELFSYLSDAGFKVKSLVGKKSIFEAYSEGFKKLNCNPDDIIVLCHDDIEIKTHKAEFKHQLDFGLASGVGFAGIAGTRKLNSDGIWWNWNDPQYMRGEVFHGTKEKNSKTYFGRPGKVVVLDGVFLACRASVLMDLNLTKPESFIGDWDFYDINLTFQATLKKYTNIVLPIIVRHESPGLPRESWDKNRLEFCKQYSDKLPYVI